MTQIKANGIDIEYETRGEVSNTPLVLVRGLGTQLAAWPEDYLEDFVSAGYYVVIYDNRDVGLSQKFGDMPSDSRAEVIEALKDGRTPTLAYTIADTAADLIGLMDALGIDKAHIAGMSMGGMIIQVAAATYSDRLLSATSIMSGVGDPALPQPGPEVMQALTETSTSDDLEDLIAFSVKGSKVFTGKGRPTPDADIEARERKVISRCYYPEGVARQMLAIMASGDRSELCRGIEVPFLVVHGTDDPLVLPVAGKDTAAKVPGAKLHMVEGMGHDLPDSCREEIVGVIVGHMRGEAR
jgi:pimeloyl-ACP methyl ester carboxylesterase